MEMPYWAPSSFITLTPDPSPHVESVSPASALTGGHLLLACRTSTRRSSHDSLHNYSVPGIKLGIPLTFSHLTLQPSHLS